jgi:hypothetical protein
MTDLAIKNGVYLKTLTKKETVAVMAEIILEHDLAATQYQEAIDTADIVISYYPNYVPAMLEQGTAAAYLMDIEFKQKYPTLHDVPADLLPTYILLDQQNHEDFARAESLGWRESDGETTETPQSTNH